MNKDEKWLLQEKYGGTPSPAFHADCLRLKSGEPLAYVIGHQPFLGLTIWLDSKPLIPRPETEWWTEELLNKILERQEQSVSDERVSQRDGARVGNFSAEKDAALSEETSADVLTFLDLCAGSGAIGCAALRRLPHAKVFFAELDSTHESTIRKNIRENNLDETRAAIRTGDLFAPFEGMRFDVIAANPPYIPNGRTLPESVSAHEPATALFGGDDGLEIIRRIASGLHDHLAPQGQAWIECDESHAPEAAELFKALGYVAEIRTDPYGRQRLIVVSFA